MRTGKMILLVAFCMTLLALTGCRTCQDVVVQEETVHTERVVEEEPVLPGEGGPQRQ